MKDIDQLELIEKYLEGSLTAEQLSDVEQRISSDANFSKEVEWQRQAMEQLADPGMRLFQQQLHAYKAEAKTGTGTEKKTAKVVQMRPVRRALAIAASVAVLAVAGFWVYQQGQPDVDPLFAGSHSVYPDNVSGVYQEEKNDPYRSGTFEDRKEDFIKAMKNYPDNAALLETHILEYPADKMARFYLAQVYLQNGHFNKASELLIALKNDPGFEEHAAANWYLALTFLKQGKISKSKQLLQELATGDAMEYKEKAIQLLDKLEK